MLGLPGLERLIQCCVISTCLALPCAANASTVNIKLTIDKLKHVNSGFGYGDDFYATGRIGGSAYKSSTKEVDEGKTKDVNWSFSAAVDPRTLTSYDVPIKLAIREDDILSSDDPLDVSPGRGNDLSFNYNLKTGIPNVSSPQAGASKNRGKVWFSLSSDPLVYSASITSTIQEMNDAYLARYDFMNEPGSHYNVSSIAFPGMGILSNFDPIEPGQALGNGIITASAIKGYARQIRDAVFYFDDPMNTTRVVQVEVLVPSAVPVPATLPLFGAGLLMLGALRRRVVR